MKMLKVILSFLSTTSHLVPFLFLYLALEPISRWYLSKIPILGVDFYNSVGYVSFLAKNLPLQVNGFKDIWFGGYPLYREFVSLHWYLMVPFYKQIGPVLGVQIYVLTALFLLACFSYLLYFQLSKSRALALFIAFLVLYSVNIYGSAMWGGSLPFFSTQLFLPFVLVLVDRYLVTSNIRWFLASILVSGIGFLAHPLPMFAFTLPCVAILLFFGLKVEHKKILGNVFVRTRTVAIFILGSLLVALPVSYERLYFTLNSFTRGGFSVLFAFITPQGDKGAGGSSSGAGSGEQVSNFYKGLFKLLYEDTNQLLFGLLVLGVMLFVVTFVLVRKKGVFLRVIPYVLIVGYAVMHTYLNAFGHSFFPQGWYREFWAFPILLGALIAVLWGQFFDLVRRRLAIGNWAGKIAMQSLPFMLLALVLFVFGYQFFTSKVGGVIAVVDSKSEISSAHPQALSIRTSKSDLEEIKKQLLPDFINPDDRNKRLYEADALVNIWWNALYNLPLARGYADPPIASSQRGGLFWLDIAVGNDSLVRDFKVSENIAFNNALFLIDWNAIYYYEGGRFGISAAPPPSSYLLKNNVFEKEEEMAAYGALIKWQTPSGKPELNYEIPQYLKFFKVKDEFTSPVIYPSNASTILVISDLPGYEDVLRGLGSENLNSKYVIPVNGGKNIDSFKLAELKKFDAIILHNYAYKNRGKAFDLLKKYVEGGGKIFIDTGAESSESVGDNLPEIFPFKSSKREGQGKQWELEATEDKLLEGVNTKNFGDLIFNDSEWKIAFSRDGSLRQGASAILKQKGKPVLVKREFASGGIVVWSGFNLVYHFNQYKNDDELKLFGNIVKSLAPIAKSDVVAADASWLSPEKIILSSKNGARGVLFKEQHYGGWHARLTSGNKGSMRIYSVGPTHPGYMYVFLDKNEPFTMEFSFKGHWVGYLVHITAAVLMILILDKAVFGGYLLLRHMRIFGRVSNKKISKWWEKEDE